MFKFSFTCTAVSTLTCLELVVLLAWLTSFRQMTQQLLELGAEMGLQGSDGMTPLHYACRCP